MISDNHRSDRRLDVIANHNFYESLWSKSRLIPPERFNTWPLLQSLGLEGRMRLEVGPGMCPRLTVPGTYFVDISRSALLALEGLGGLSALGEITTLPFPDSSFDLVCVFDVIEHVDDDRSVLHEVSRVGKDFATVIVSVPLHPERWTAFDTLVGHIRRYRAEELENILRQHSLVVEQSACFGMQPRNRWLLKFAVWGLTQRPVGAVRLYKQFLLPLGLLMQRRLNWSAGLIDLTRIDEVILVCRRHPRPAAGGKQSAANGS